MRGERRALFLDEPDRSSDGLGYADSRAFFGRGESPVAAPQSDRAREFLGQDVEFVLQGTTRRGPAAKLAEAILASGNRLQSSWHG